MCWYSFHTVCCILFAEDGRLWVWGSNCDGQLGIERQFDVTTPTEMKLDQNISFIASGYYHSALVTGKYS